VVFGRSSWLMARGAWLTAHGSLFVAHGSRLVARAWPAELPCTRILRALCPDGTPAAVGGRGSLTVSAGGPVVAASACPMGDEASVAHGSRLAAGRCLEVARVRAIAAVGWSCGGLRRLTVHPPGVATWDAAWGGRSASQ
jgi:hypothetical protein